MQIFTTFDRLYSISDHLLVSLVAPIIAHLLQASIMLFSLGTLIELGVHSLSESVELKVSICVSFHAMLFKSLVVLNCVIRNPS